MKSGITSWAISEGEEEKERGTLKEKSELVSKKKQKRGNRVSAEKRDTVEGCLRHKTNNECYRRKRV